MSLNANAVDRDASCDPFIYVPDETLRLGVAYALLNSATSHQLAYSINDSRRGKCSLLVIIDIQLRSRISSAGSLKSNLYKVFAEKGVKDTASE